MLEVLIGREFAPRLIELVKQARLSIKILVFDWRWYDGEVGSKCQIFNNEIILAKRRGVEVSAVVNSPFVCRQFQDQGINIKQSELKNTLHVKMVIIDSKYVFVGSHNLTKNAFEINHELSLLSDDENAIKECEAFFDSVKK